MADKTWEAAREAAGGEPGATRILKLSACCWAAQIQGPDGWSTTFTGLCAARAVAYLAEWVAAQGRHQLFDGSDEKLTRRSPARGGSRPTVPGSCRPPSRSRATRASYG